MLEALGNIGDFVGGLAVVATLLYLAVQVRQNTRALRAAAFDSAAEQFAQSQLALAQNPDLADLVERGSSDYTALPRAERRRYRAYFGQQLRNHEANFLKFQERLLSRSQWEGYRAAVIYAFGRPGWQQCWTEIKPSYSAEFRDYVDGIIASRARSGPAA
jgi:hypothetical protein